MTKEYFFIALIVILLILSGCNNNILTNNEVVKLDNIKTPDRLEILSPNLNKKNQELAITGLEISDLMNNSDNLSNDEMKELEEKIVNYTIEVDEFRNQIIKINSKEVIENIFNRIRESRGTYDRYLSEDILRNSDYYYVQVFYEDIDIHAQNLDDGYISVLYMFKDNTLVFFDKLFDGESEPRKLRWSSITNGLRSKLNSEVTINNVTLSLKGITDEKCSICIILLMYILMNYMK